MVCTLEKFDVSPTRGFIPDKPLARLPEYFSPWEQVCDELPSLWKVGITRSAIEKARLPEYFSPWEQVCDELPSLWKVGITRSAIEKLPLLDHTLLASEEEWQRAHSVLGFMTHAYVWCEGEKSVAKILPKVVAVPFFAVSRHLDLPPVVCQHSTINTNWKKIDPERPASIGNIQVLNSFTGTQTEDGFYLTTVEVELEFGKGGAVILVEGQQAVQAKDVDKVVTLLESLHQIICNMKSALRHIHDVCDPKEFYFGLRPFLNGWKEGTVLTDGLVYEGVSSKPMKFHGGSSAQSSVFHAIDEFLGVKHETNTGKEHFLKEMRIHMPPKHRAFIEAIANGPSLKDFVLQQADPNMTSKYNECVDALTGYRNIHLQIAARYVVIQANNSKASDNNPDKRIAKISTAGSGVMPLLKGIRNDTRNRKMSCD